jgi:hypothetical protein
MSAGFLVHNRGLGTRNQSGGRAHIEPLEGRRLMTAAVPRFDHIVVVVEENHSQTNIIGSASAPYINSLANNGANFTQSYAITHPSQPNYIALFSGSTQGVTSDTVPSTVFTTPNLGAELIGANLSFAGYSESQPSAGYLGTSYTSVVGQNQYFRKHNPWSDWQSATPTGYQLPASVNQPLTSFPADFTQLPSVSFVIPNEQNDMHDGSVAQGDAWLKTNLDAYAQWAKNNNSLLIVTWDEDDKTAGNRIATVFSGAHVRTGQYSETINHFNVLRTIEESYDLGHAGAAATATAIADCWDTSPVVPPSPPPPTTTLPTGWSSGDVGSPAQKGNSTYNATTKVYSVRGGGADIWNKADQFQFASRSATGDKTVIARVSSLQNTNSFAKAGVMIRNDRTAGSAYVGVFMTPSSGLTFQWRNSSGVLTTQTRVTGIYAPKWVKLVRKGNVFSAYYSSNGSTWFKVGTSHTVYLKTTALAGLAVTSHNTGLLSTATFSNVSVV